MATRQFDVSKDINTRVNNDGKSGRGGNAVRYIGKGESGEYFRMLVKFDLDWSGMDGGKVTAASLWFTTNEGPAGWDIGSGASMRIYALKEEFDDNGGDDWSSGAYDNPKIDSAKAWNKKSGIPTTDNQPFNIDIITYLQRVGSGSVSFLIGSKYVKGDHAKYSDHGLRIMTPEETHSQERFAVFSGDHSSTPSGKRPYIEVEWEPKNTPPQTVWGQPSGPSSSQARYQGNYYDAQGQRIHAAQVQVWRVSDDRGNDKARFDSGKVYSEESWPDDQYDLSGPDEDHLLPKKAKDGTLITYEGIATTWDSANAASDPTNPADGHFTITSDSPTVTPVAMGSLKDLENTQLKANWTIDPTASRVSSYRVQLTNRSDDDVWAETLWDKIFVPTADEQKNQQAKFDYGGPGLLVGDYTWRIAVIDGLDEESEWGYDRTLHLTQGKTHPDDPDDTTAYGRTGVTTRLVMKAVDTTSGHKRRPGVVVAIIEDARDLSVSGYATSTGQISFTLGNRHPQIGAMEPMRTVWSLQQYRGAQWKELASGLLTDFDATENDTVFTGLDWVGVLSLSIEAQKQPANNADAQWSKGGAKYVNHTIGYIISDQLGRAIKAPDSLIGFFTIPPGGIDNMSEKVTIHAAYVQRLDFVRGLLDSHKGGALGRRPRISARYNDLTTKFELTVRSSAGRDRDNLVFQYGSLVQAYRVMGLGDWGDRVYGVGRLRNALTPNYETVDAPGNLVPTFGEVAKTNVWQDISDTHDLQRRARAMATSVSRIGKRVALGLRVQGLALLDGWNICDSIRIDIDDGTVDTGAYGTQGWWTIQGWEWRLYADGHDELTLVITPREDISGPIDDLIPSDPIHIQPEWSIKNHAPPGH